jgi:hypothetical protein
MKRGFLVVFAFAFTAFAAGAQDASLALATDLTYSDQAFAIYEKATPSFSLPIGETSEIAGNGFVKVAFDWALPSTTLTVPFTYGLEQLRYELAVKKPSEAMSAFVFDTGRFAFSDPSGYILSSPADGFSFLFKYPAVEVALRSAYTGLLFLDDSNISMSLADQARVSAATELGGSPRFIAQADLTLPRLFGQTFVLSCLSQNDLNPTTNLAKEGATSYEIGKGGKLTTQYFELMASGFAITVEYNVFFAYGSGTTLTWFADSASSSGYSYQYKYISSFLTGAYASVPLGLPKPFNGSSVNARILFASGDKDASSATEGNTMDVYKAFTPISSNTIGTDVFLPELSNLVLAEASFLTSPTIGVCRIDGAVKVRSFLRPTAGPISEAGIDSGSTSSYLGTECDLSLSSGIFSDLRVSLISGVFVPGSAFAAANSALQYSVGLTATITM